MTLFELVGKIVIQNQEANEQIKETTGIASKSGDGISGAFKKIGGAVATFFAADKIKDFGMSCINAVADANAANSQFSQVFGDLESQASGSLSSIADSAGITENRMKGSYTKIAAFAKTTGMDTESALALSERAMIAVADSAAFYDRSLEDTTESLQSFLKGNYENDAALGLSCTETTRNAAANELYGKSFNDLSESQKQLTLLQMVEDANKASGALGQAARESDTWTNQTGNLKQAWTDFQAVLGEPVLEYAVSVVGWLAEKVSGLTEKFSTGTNPVQWFIDKIKDGKARLEEIGGYASETLQPILSDLETAFNYVKDAVQPLIDKFSEYVTSGEAAEDITNLVKDAIDFLADAYQSVCDFVTNLVTGWQNAVTWAQQHETTVSLLAIAFGTLTAAIVAYNIAQAIKNAGGIVELAQLAALAVGVGALTVAETAHTVATTIATAATSAFGAVLSFITSPITLVVLAIGALIAIGVALYKNWDTVKAFCLDVWDKIKTGVSEAVDALKEWILNAWNSVKTWTTNAWNNVKTAISNAWNGIKSGVSNAINAVKTTITNIWNSIKTTTSNIWNGIKAAVSSVWEGIKSAVSNAINGVKSVISSVWNTIKTTTSNIWNGIKSTISGVWNGIKSTVSNVVNGVKSTVSSVFNSIKSTASSVWNSIKTAITNPIETAKTAVKNAIDKIKGFFDFEWSLPDLKLPHLTASGKFSLTPPSVPKFSIEWYKKAYDEAMILNDPAIFGFSAASGKLLGGGDGNGGEVVAGEAHLMDLIGSTVESKVAAQNEKIISLLTALLNAIIGGNEELLRAFMTDRTFTVGEREFARLVKQYA